jgi:hypothetical protein
MRKAAAATNIELRPKRKRLSWQLIIDNFCIFYRLVFLVKEKSENEFFARAVGESVFVIATSRSDLRKQVKEKLKEQFYPQLIPNKVRFRFYKDVVLKLDFN